mmetsp:Transcript_13624/g.29194  ORF Transcript_13624/g.29194 Transcript_13624/m.29194 type:complete len:242 (+) Transcript_13624:132-857(+)|eukprot:CAMPEP_0202903906 /NCGR_PEP_ID=MMETSP1392-20130828/27067_1 /ASSEMBLY_ACC=CAM_ASM_000868 /TAXON_ID=225041 /ORGANISM="Chlamydomonas chlamydogama, Strain SAG 11-48b" /LENGTH=241 /DNA_ID=CAMNT_0049591275 /DNA_START=67 /DNA_END=792 /DNA_ORIENTATION=-
MNFFEAYNSGSDDEEGKPKHLESSDDSEDSDSSVDSAALRAAEAEARLKDFEKAAGDTGRALPSALAAFDEVDGPPSFLDPEATRPLAASRLHGMPDVLAAEGTGKGGKVWQEKGPDFDISVLAPPLKGQQRNNPDKREMPASAVIEGKAKRYKTEEGPEATQQYSEAQIAMLGGKVTKSSKAPSGPMGVSDFLAKGVGAAQLPRKAQDRKDKEKEKRMKGQSAIGSWKSEAEMVLRQQYD